MACVKQDASHEVSTTSAPAASHHLIKALNQTQTHTHTHTPTHARFLGSGGTGLTGVERYVTGGAWPVGRRGVTGALLL